MNRCRWANPNNPLYLDYHDHEWGVPVHDDHKLFEMLVLEAFQAGLSWECVLNKREDFRRAFDGFDVLKVLDYDDCKVDALCADKSIIRNRLKVRAAINNARCFVMIQNDFGSFDSYIWGFARSFLALPPDAPEPLLCQNDVSSSPLSDALSRNLRLRGMKFVGSTIVYSLLQAIGVINSHDDVCFCRSRIFCSPTDIP